MPFFEVIFCARGVVGEGKENPLTLISDVRSKEISLQTVGQTAEPPALAVFVQDLDQVTPANGELVRSVCVVVVEHHNLEKRRNEGGGGGEARPRECREEASIRRGPRPERSLTRG